METDLLLWRADAAVGCIKSSAATYPTEDVTTDRIYIPFDDTTVEACLFQGIMPQGYDSGQTLKLDLYYYMASAVAGKVDFDVSVEAISDGDAINMGTTKSLDSANSANETVNANTGYPGVLTVTLTNKDSVSVGDLIRIVIERDADDATDDTATGDCNVLAARLYQST